jgi:hypothetical protein
VTIRILPGMDADASVSVTYTADPGGSASDSITLFVPTWTPGEPIICEGIQAPEDQAVFAVGEEVALTINPPTDADIRTAASSETYSDDCVVTWAASAGTFKDGVNTGNSVIWIAPDSGQAVTISATVADKAEVPSGEKGERDDADYTDSITVLVCDISVTIPSIVSVNQSAIPVRATLMAGSTPVSGRSVTFSSSDLSFSSSTAVTDASGVATVTATASSSPSAALNASSVTASFDSVSDTANFTIVEVYPTSANSDSIIVGALAVDSLYSSLLTFTVSPAISGVPLTFSFQSGTGVGYSIPAALESPSASTDASGCGTVRLRSGDLRENATVMCTYEASTATKTVAITGITSVQ